MFCFIEVSYIASCLRKKMEQAGHDQERMWRATLSTEMSPLKVIKGSLDEKLPSYELLKMLKIQ